MSDKKQTKGLGGKREGAGRKKGEPTKALGLRVPERFHAQLTEIVREELNRLLAAEKKIK
jgi:hypothetical protein